MPALLITLYSFAEIEIKMIRILFFLLLATPCFAQEIVTFRIDSIGRQNWQLTTTTTYQRADSTLSQRSESVKLGNRKQAKEFVVLALQRANFARQRGVGRCQTATCIIKNGPPGDTFRT